MSMLQCCQFSSMIIGVLLRFQKLVTVSLSLQSVSPSNLMLHLGRLPADALSFPLVTIKHFTMPLPSFEGLCGWVLLRRWFNRHAPELNEHLSKVIANWDVACLFPGCQEGSVTDMVCPISARVLDFARILRSAFLTSFVCPPTTRDFWPASHLDRRHGSRFSTCDCSFKRRRSVEIFLIHGCRSQARSKRSGKIYDSLRITRS